MKKDNPLWWKIYFDAVYTEVCHTIGYQGCTYRQLTEKIEELAKRFDKRKVESAICYLATFEGQLTCNPDPLTHVGLRAEVRRFCWQLLGPAPEHGAEFDLPPLRCLTDAPPAQTPEEAPKPKKHTRNQ